MKYNLNITKSFFLWIFTYLIFCVIWNLLVLNQINYFYIIIAILSYLISFIFTWKNLKKKYIIFTYLNVFIWLILFKYIYDISFDWNTYHLYIIKEILAKNNLIYWNYGEIFNYLNFYPKIIEIIFSLFWSIFWENYSRIFKIFLISVTFLNYFELLNKLKLKKDFKNIIIWILIILNTVVINQFFTLYIDDVLYLLFLNWIFYFFEGSYIFWSIVLVLASFSKINFILFSCIWVFISLILKHKILKDFDYKKILNKKNILIILAITIICGYQNILNTFNYWNPFYGFVWKSKNFALNMANDKPPLLKSWKNQDFFYTYSSLSNIDCKIDNHCLKPINLISLNWIKDFFSSYKLTYIYDLQTWWFWNIYNIILILGLFWISWKIVYLSVKKDFNNDFYLWISALTFGVIIILVMPILWARYVSLLYLIWIVFYLIIKNKIIKNIILSLLISNLSLILAVNWYFYTKKIINQTNINKILSIKNKEVLYYQKDWQLSQDIDIFLNKNELKSYNQIWKKEILEICWKQNWYICKNWWYLFNPNYWSFIDELIFINQNNQKYADFLKIKPEIEILKSSTKTCKNDIKINNKIITDCDYETILNTNATCENWYKLLSLNDWQEIIDSFWVNKNDIIEKLNFKNIWYFDENNILAWTWKYYMQTSDKKENKVWVVIFKKDYYENIFYKNNNQKFYYRCLKK